MEGTCKIVCKKSEHKFTLLEYDKDPTKAMRDEKRKHKDPKTSQGASQLVKKAMGDEEERYKDPKTRQSVSQLVNNGYVA